MLLLYLYLSALVYGASVGTNSSSSSVSSLTGGTSSTTTSKAGTAVPELSKSVSKSEAPPGTNVLVALAAGTSSAAVPTSAPPPPPATSQPISPPPTTIAPVIIPTTVPITTTTLASPAPVPTTTDITTQQVTATTSAQTTKVTVSPIQKAPSPSSAQGQTSVTTVPVPAPGPATPPSPPSPPSPPPSSPSAPAGSSPAIPAPSGVPSVRNDGGAGAVTVNKLSTTGANLPLTPGATAPASGSTGPVQPIANGNGNAAVLADPALGAGNFSPVTSSVVPASATPNGNAPINASDNSATSAGISTPAILGITAGVIFLLVMIFMIARKHLSSRHANSTLNDNGNRPFQQMEEKSSFEPSFASPYNLEDGVGMNGDHVSPVDEYYARPEGEEISKGVVKFSEITLPAVESHRFSSGVFSTDDFMPLDKEPLEKAAMPVEENQQALVDKAMHKAVTNVRDSLMSTGSSAFMSETRDSYQDMSVFSHEIPSSLDHFQFYE